MWNIPQINRFCGNTDNIMSSRYERLLHKMLSCSQTRTKRSSKLCKKTKTWVLNPKSLLVCPCLFANDCTLFLFMPSVSLFRTGVTKRLATDNTVWQWVRVDRLQSDKPKITSDNQSTKQMFRLRDLGQQFFYWARITGNNFNCVWHGW